MKYFNRTLVRLAFLFCPFLTILSCGNNPSEATNQPPIITSLTANSDELDWGGSSQLVVIAADPEGQSLSYLWEALYGTFLTSTTNDTVTWQAPDSSGSFILKVTISDGGNTITASDTINVKANPQLSIANQSTLDFGTSSTTQTFTIQNSGSGTLNWNISDDAPWLSVSPASGSTTTETETITVTVDRATLPSDSNSATITVSSDGGTKTVSVSAQKQAENTVTGRWRQRFTLSGTLFIGYYNLVQNGTTLTGDFVFSDGSGYTALSSSSYIRGTSINMAWWLQTILLESRGTVSSSWNSMSGTMYARGSAITTWTATKMSSSAMVVAAPPTPSGKSMAEQFNQTMQKGVGF